jgi:alkylation response protein AidB-like acyl-CoA dehydrogenase
VNEEIEDVESFRLRARQWIQAHLPRLKGSDWSGGQAQFNDEAWARARELQKVLYESGYVGLRYPKEHGGQGLTPAHQPAFTGEVAEYEMPLVLDTPTFTICGPTTNVRVPAEDVLGEVNGGWTVATKQLSYERIAVSGGSRYASGRQLRESSDRTYEQLIDIARRTGQAGNRYVRELIAESYAISETHSQLVGRVVSGMQTGNLPAQASTIIRLYRGESGSRAAEWELEIAGPGAVAFPEEPDAGRDIGEGFLSRQAGSLGGGSTEMAGNIISERVLGMPREYAADRDVPFSEVRRSRRGPTAAPR